MRLLLTGERGFTGRYVREAAAAAGYEVHGLQADLTDLAATRRSVETIAPTHVIHLGAISAVTHDDQIALYRVNLFGTLHLLQALEALATPPRKVVLASSANVYGNSAQSPIREGTPPAPVNHYAMSKLAMEHMSATHAEQLPVVVTRPFNYTGVGHDQRFVIPKLIHHFARRAARIELGNLDVEREFNDVRPVSTIYVRLLERGVPGETYNICSGTPVSLRSVIATLEELSGHRAEISVNPAFVRRNEVFRLCGDPSKTEACIGPVNHEALRDTLDWMLRAASPGE